MKPAYLIFYTGILVILTSGCYKEDYDLSLGSWSNDIHKNSFDSTHDKGRQHHHIVLKFTCNEWFSANIFSYDEGIDKSWEIVMKGRYKFFRNELKLWGEYDYKRLLPGHDLDIMKKFRGVSFDYALPYEYKSKYELVLNPDKTKKGVWVDIENTEYSFQKVYFDRYSFDDMSHCK